MVELQLRRRGIEDTQVLEAMAQVPRHVFVPKAHRTDAYVDAALPLSLGQTISQPLMVATALEALQLAGDEKALDVGTGSGYQAAVLSRLVRQVYGVEILAELTERARAAVGALGYTNVRIAQTDGRLGLPEFAPYDAIVVAAGTEKIPPPLLEQLADGGRLVIPLGDNKHQTLVCVTRNGDEFSTRDICKCVYVPLVKGGE